MANKSRKRTPSTAQTVTTGSTIRFEVPKSGRKPKQKITAVVMQEYSPVGGFVTFLREHAIVGLAVGFVVATQVQAVVKQLITSFIDPLYGLFFSQRLSAKVVTLHWHGRSQQFGWGAFAYTLLDFLFVLAVIYAIIKFLNLDKLDMPKEETKTEEQLRL